MDQPSGGPNPQAPDNPYSRAAAQQVPDNPYARAAAEGRMQTPPSSPPPVEPPLKWSPGGPADAQPSPAPSQTNAAPHLTPTRSIDPTDPFAALPEYRQSAGGNTSAAAAKVALGVLIGAAVVALGLLAYAVIPENVAAPDKLDTFVSSDKSFQMQIPEGWSVSELTTKTSKTPNNEVLIRKGSARIDIVLQPMEDLAHNMTTAMISNTSTFDAVKYPAGMAHAATEWRGSYTHGQYHEDTPKTVKTKFGGGAYSEFTGKGGLWGWGGSMHGYRATVFSYDHSYLMMLECPEASWNGLAPTFMQVISSIGPGDGSTISPDDDFSGTSTTTPGSSSGS